MVPKIGNHPTNIPQQIKFGSSILDGDLNKRKQQITQGYEIYNKINQAVSNTDNKGMKKATKFLGSVMVFAMAFIGAKQVLSTKKDFVVKIIVNSGKKAASFLEKQLAKIAEKTDLSKLEKFKKAVTQPILKYIKPDILEKSAEKVFNRAGDVVSISAGLYAIKKVRNNSENSDYEIKEMADKYLTTSEY